MTKGTIMEQKEITEHLLAIISPYMEKLASKTMEQEPVVEFHSPDDLRALLDLNKDSPGNDWQVLLDWVEQYLQYAVNTSHPAYVNRMWSGANPPSIMGEVITALTNTSSCTFETAPVAVLMEQYMIETMIKLVGFPNGHGQMTTGSSNANMIAMLAARNTLGQDAKQEGLFDSQPLFAFVNQEAHYSMDRAANILGIGSEHLVQVPVHSTGQMNHAALADLLEQVCAQGGKPFFVAATAGTTVRGAYDEILPLLALREKYGFWLHVDGAWGGAVLFSDRLKKRFLQGLDQADSFTLDFHKMLGTSLMCNVLLMNRGADIFRKTCGAGDESYIFRPYEDDTFQDPGTDSLQCGRRVDALKWFLDWKFYGHAGFGRRIERYFDLCLYAKQKIESIPELEFVTPLQSFNLCFRYVTPESIDSSEFTLALRTRLQKQGTSLTCYAYLHGQRVFRLLITNPRIDEAFLDTYFDSLVSNGRALVEEVLVNQKEGSTA